jgi:hypothetical protein
MTNVDISIFLRDHSFPVFQRADVERVVRMNSGGLSFEISQVRREVGSEILLSEISLLWALS